MLRKQISFRKGDEDVYKYLDNLPNASQFIVRLVRQYMNSEQSISKQEVIQIIQEVLNKNSHDPEATKSLKKFLDM